MAWQIDPAHTTIEFSVKHMMITRVRGRFDEFEGTLVLDESNPENSHAEGTIQVASITTNSPDRDNHLRSGDFFDVEAYPTMHFESTRVEQVDDDHFKVYGDLTIKETTREVVWDVTVEGKGIDPWGNQRIGLSARTEIDRKNFGLTWNAPLETGGVLVGDDVRIEVQLQAIQQQEQPEAEAATA